MKAASKSARTAKTRRAPRKTRKESLADAARRGVVRAPPPRLMRPPPLTTPTAVRVTVRVYRQGLGDCILVRVKRSGRDDFKLMIDCGVVLGTPDAAKTMTRVMENSGQRHQEKVDVLAITHEHWDHLSGFTQAAGLLRQARGRRGLGRLDRRPERRTRQSAPRSELGKAKRQARRPARARCARSDDGATADALEDIALIPLGAAAASSGSTKAAFDKVKARGNVQTLPPERSAVRDPGRQRPHLRARPTARSEAHPQDQSVDQEPRDLWARDERRRRAASWASSRRWTAARLSAPTKPWTTRRRRSIRE